MLNSIYQSQEHNFTYVAIHLLLVSFLDTLIRGLSETLPRFRFFKAIIAMSLSSLVASWTLWFRSLYCRFFFPSLIPDGWVLWRNNGGTVETLGHSEIESFAYGWPTYVGESIICSPVFFRGDGNTPWFEGTVRVKPTFDKGEFLSVVLISCCFLVKNELYKKIISLLISLE